MKKFFNITLLLGITLTSFAQQSNNGKQPLFSSCQDNQNSSCFYNTIQDYVFHNFVVPDSLANGKYKGTIHALIQSDTLGRFSTLYVTSDNKQLDKETVRVIESLPKVTPVIYDGRPTYSKFSIKINIPLEQYVPAEEHAVMYVGNDVKAKQKSTYTTDRKDLNEVNGLVEKPYKNAQFKSHLNIPFSHAYYANFDAYINQVGANAHTAAKPLNYAEVAKYYDFEKAQSSISKNKTSWWGRKLWDENLVAIQGENYWFTLNPVFDIRVGKDFNSDSKSTYVNTRALNVQGGLGKQINFTATVFESQGRFADYYNDYARSLKPSGGNPAVIPGIGIAKEFKTDGFDFPSADANISYTPSEIFNLQLGYGRNFIGDGYRSLILGDASSPYPYFKLNTTFWKIKYTNTYTWLKDIRPEVTEDKTYATKFMANHYLSWNVTNRWNLGFFETVIWSNTNDRGFDANFINPIIFYRSVEFSSSSKSGNAALGLTSKYKFTKNFNMYGQLFLDELSVKDFTGGEKSWKNKYAYQIGAKYYDAFQVKNLTLQLEYNYVRPYTYSHSEVLTNYGHNNQSLGHLWGSNFKELVAIARYTKGRVFADAKLIYGTKGLDFNDVSNTYNYGGNIYLSYDDQRYQDINVAVGQGNKTKIINGELQAGYLINPNMNLKLFGSYVYRNFKPTVETPNVVSSQTNWLSIGIRSDLFNMYSDF